MHYFSIQTAAKNILVKIKPYRKREPRHYRILFFVFSKLHNYTNYQKLDKQCKLQ